MTVKTILYCSDLRYLCPISMEDRLILNELQFAITVDRLCHQLVEDYSSTELPVIIGVQPRGIQFAERILSRLEHIHPQEQFLSGKLDPSFYRDDFRMRSKTINANETDIPFSIENKRVILVDDVLYTGRTIRSALDALMDFGRPAAVELMVLIDRRMQRHLPIEATYIGKKVDSIQSEKVRVSWQNEQSKDEVWITLKSQEA